MLFLFGEYSLEPVRRELRRGEALVTITAQQLDLLIFLVTSRGRLLSKQDLLAHVWKGATVAENVVSVAVAKLRKVIGNQPTGTEYIANHYARGYSFLAKIARPELVTGAEPQQLRTN